MLKNWLRCAASASGQFCRRPAAPFRASAFPFQSVRSFADPASVASCISIFNGVRTASSYFLQAAQAKGLDFQLELSMLDLGLRSLQQQTLPHNIQGLLDCRMTALAQEAEKLREPGFVQQLKDYATLHVAQEKFRLRLSWPVCCRVRTC